MTIVTEWTMIGSWVG